jgi:hypothetical protein
VSTALIFQHIRLVLAEPVAAADVGEIGPGVGVAGEVP